MYEGTPQPVVHEYATEPPFATRKRRKKSCARGHRNAFINHLGEPAATNNLPQGRPKRNRLPIRRLERNQLFTKTGSCIGLKDQGATTPCTRPKAATNHLQDQGAPTHPKGRHASVNRSRNYAVAAAASRLPRNVFFLRQAIPTILART